MFSSISSSTFALNAGLAYLVCDGLGLGFSDDLGDGAGLLAWLDDGGCADGFGGHWLRDDGGLLLVRSLHDWDFGNNGLLGVGSGHVWLLGDAGGQLIGHDILGDAGGHGCWLLDCGDNRLGLLVVNLSSCQSGILLVDADAGILWCIL